MWKQFMSLPPARQNLIIALSAGVITMVLLFLVAFGVILFAPGVTPVARALIVGSILAGLGIVYVMKLISRAITATQKTREDKGPRR